MQAESAQSLFLAAFYVYGKSKEIEQDYLTTGDYSTNFKSLLTAS